MIYVMSDIHGNRRRFDSVMAQINLQPEDHLYVIGDVVDRHPDGISILLQLMGMKNVTVLLGNHEYMMLNVFDPARQTDEYERRENVRRWLRNGAEPTIEAYEALDAKTQNKVICYLNRMPLTKSLIAGHKRYMLVHAAPPELYYPYYHSVEEFCVWYRMQYNTKLPKGYTLIFGHTTTKRFVRQERDARLFEQGVEEFPPYPIDYMSIWYGDHRICIDCGSGYPDTFDPEYGAMGRLACLRLDDLKEFYSDERFQQKEVETEA